MACLLYSAADYDQQVFDSITTERFDYTERTLTATTAYMAAGYDAVCAFVNDDLSAPVMVNLHRLGVKTVLLRCAGFDRVDTAKAEELGIKVARVPAYCPEAIAEHTLALTLAAVRKLRKSEARQSEGHYNLDGLVGFTLRGKKVGIIGAGRIGQLTGELFRAFGSKVSFYDPYYHGTDAVDLCLLNRESDVIVLNAPLTKETRYMINATFLAQCKAGVVIVNTARGALVNTADLLDDLVHTHHVGAYATDVYEDEAGVFFEKYPRNDVRLRHLREFDNVTITGHQAFLTVEALNEIAQITAANYTALKAGTDTPNRVV